MAQYDNNNESAYDGEQKEQAPFPFALVIFILSPFTIASALLTYAAFTWGRIKLSTIFWYSLVPYLVAMLFFWQYALANFIVSWTYTMPGIIKGEIGVTEGLISFFLQQALLGIPIGIGAGLIYSWLRWKKRLGFEEESFRLSPLEYYKKLKTVTDIESDKGASDEGMTLGVEMFGAGDRIIQLYKNSKAHTMILGASGSGKTETLLSRLRDSIQSGHGAVIVDLKGGPDLPERVSKFAKRVNKNVTHFVFHPQNQTYTGPAILGPAHYDPLNRGEATRRKDLFLNTREYESEYYKENAEAFLQLVFSVMVANPNTNVSTLEDMLELSDPVKLQKRAAVLASNPIYHTLVKNIDALNDTKLDDGQKSAIKGLETKVSLLINSVVGPYLQLDDKNTENNIDLFQAALRGDIIIFSLDSSNYPDQSALIANLITQDLKTVSSELRTYNDLLKREERGIADSLTGREKKEALNALNNFEAYKPFHVIIDEFSAIGSENVVGLLNKCRDANMPVTLTTQALGDLRKKNKSLQDQLLGIMNSFIIHRSNVYSDAEELANLAGKTRRKRFTESYSYSKKGFFTKGSTSGQGSVEEVEDFVIKPTEIQELTTGEFWHINKSPMKVEHGRCIMENPGRVNERAIKIDDEDEPIKIDMVLAQQALHLVEQEESPERPLAPVVQTIGGTSRPVGAIISTSAPQPTSKVGGETLVVPSKAPNMNRLSELFNQNPEELLPERTPEPYKVTIMPPRVATALPPLPNKPTLGKIPPLPVLPPLPSVPKPIQETPPVSNSKEIKDQFDF